MGRKKIEIEKLSNRETLKVTFSKRRVGLYRKASALCTSCGAHVASIAFSPGNNPFVFGHPSVLRRFLREEDGDGDHDNNLVESEGGGFWWDLPIEGLKLEELRSLKQSLEKLKKDVVDRFQEMSMRKHSDRNCLFGLIDSWPYLL